MIHIHTLPWDKCLSHQLMPAIQKGWKDEGRDVHFFWGLAGKNIRQIKECEDNGIEWWYVDVGYLTEQITRYPEPIINNYDTTYFRICKGGIHTTKTKVTNADRWNILDKQGIDCHFKDWKDGGDHILLCPSSPTVCYHNDNMTQEEWIFEIGEEIGKYTERPIKMRNKPRPGNEYWGTDIKDDLKNAWCVVTNMSLSAVDSVLNMTPSFTSPNNVASVITSQGIKLIDKPFKPGREQVQRWLNMISNHQFTIQEIEDGLAFDILKEQYQSVG